LLKLVAEVSEIEVGAVLLAQAREAAVNLLSDRILPSISNTSSSGTVLSWSSRVGRMPTRQFATRPKGLDSSQRATLGSRAIAVPVRHGCLYPTDISQTSNAGDT
jgi:hypothetical protein